MDRTAHWASGERQSGWELLLFAAANFIYTYLMQSAFLTATVLALAALTSCASPIMKTVVDEKMVDGEPRKITDRVHTLAERCWSKEQPIYKEGVIISRTSLTPEIEEIAVNRISDSKKGIVDVAYFRMEIESDNETNAKLRIYEAAVDCGFLRSCKRLGMAEEVEAWIKGGQVCTVREYQ
ncbi:MAG: hypothetical protein EOP09_09670 [Proteobacteria bacterium]|nr:MAG: hypothetical protein EOP09_09670 [Pseudomonadota bacterium]